ncbi:DUF664 domain-containing protein [Aeromicrobium sp. CF4.19]|uniref:mycothiol transferase n=1 Tax=Aeromicrobium sp. CF4.19 TaxID=3373082 RepID=UPI003EE7ED89
MVALPEPSGYATDVSAALVAYLDFYRAEVERKVTGLEDDAARSQLLPSGWTLVELLSHLVHMERRWFVWGFLAEPVTEPWGDQDGRGRWHTDADVPTLLAALHAGGRRTTRVLTEHAPTARASLGGRFHEEPPTLLAIGLHVLQEYSRHTGHADVVRELTDGTTGEAPSSP